jgi:hypothetical protein
MDEQSIHREHTRVRDRSPPTAILNVLHPARQASALWCRLCTATFDGGISCFAKSLRLPCCANTDPTPNDLMNRRIIWRGIATDTVSDDPQKNTKKIAAAVGKMF